MNKKLVLICLCFAAFSNVFGQTDFTDSARSKATSTMFTSDSDNVIADDIFSIDRAFFSAGYQPSITLGQGDSMGNMTAFWAMPINDNMTIGIAGEYQMDATRVETSTFPGAVPGSIDTTKNLDENSSFNIRPVFRFGTFAVSYRIYRSGIHLTEEDKTTIIPSGDEVLTSKVYASVATWEHEIGFAYKTSDIKFYVPIGAIINMRSSTSSLHDSQMAPDTIRNIANRADETEIFFYMNPEVGFPVEIGPIVNFRTGIDFKMAIFNPAGASENKTTFSGDSIIGTEVAEDKKVVSVKDQQDFTIGIFFETTMQWDTWEDKISFVFEPVIGVEYRNLNGGAKTTTTTVTDADGNATETIVDPIESTYQNIITPYLIANIGAIIKPVEWVELRAGLNYGLDWVNTTTTRDYELSEGGKVDEFDYSFTSKFEVYSGFGFIFGEDFFLDVYISAGNFDDKDDDFNPNSTPTRNVYDLFDIRNYGFQLTYRF